VLFIEYMALVNRVARPLSLHKINAMSCALWFTEVVWRLKFWVIRSGCHQIYCASLSAFAYCWWLLYGVLIDIKTINGAFLASIKLTCNLVCSDVLLLTIFIADMKFL